MLASQASETESTATTYSIECTVLNALLASQRILNVICWYDANDGGVAKTSGWLKLATAFQNKFLAKARKRDKSRSVQILVRILKAEIEVALRREWYEIYELRYRFLGGLEYGCGWDTVVWRLRLLALSGRMLDLPRDHYWKREENKFRSWSTRDSRHGQPCKDSDTCRPFLLSANVTDEP